MAKDLSDLDEIYEDPHAYGMPTFDEFSQNPDKYRNQFFGHSEDAFASVESGSKLLKGYVSRHIYEVEGVRCESLHHAQSMSRDMGIQDRDLDYVVELVPDLGKKCDLRVKFFSKASIAKRSAWT